MKTSNLQPSFSIARPNIRSGRDWLANTLLISILVLFPGCKKSGEDAAHNTATPQKQFVIGMSQCNLGEPWRVQQNADIQAAAAQHPELKVIFKDAQNDTLRQIYQLQEYVQQKVNLIIVSPKETQPLTGPIAQAMAAGIPVIVLDRRILGTNYTCFIGGDNKQIGYAAGKWIAQALHGKGNVVELMGLMTTTPAQQRHLGFREAIAGTDIHVIFQADMQWLQSVAQMEMESALDRFPAINLVFAANDDGAHGAYLAAKSGRRAEGMKFVGIDGLPQEGVAWVKQGILDATFQYPTGGAPAIAEALKILHGETVPKDIVLGTRMYDKANVNQGGQPVADASDAK